MANAEDVIDYLLAERTEARDELERLFGPGAVRGACDHPEVHKVTTGASTASRTGRGTP